MSGCNIRHVEIAEPPFHAISAVCQSNLILNFAGHSYSLFTLRKSRSPLILNAERGFLRVNRLIVNDKEESLDNGRSVINCMALDAGLASTADQTAKSPVFRVLEFLLTFRTHSHTYASG